MYELSPGEFLQLFYVKMTLQLKKVIELNSIKSKNTTQTKELYETKSKLIEAIDYMKILSNDQDVRNSFEILAGFIISQENRKLNIALEYCERMKAS